MQPFLAESAPRPGRVVALAVVLAVVASLAMTLRPHRSRHHEHHHWPRIGRCVQGHMYLTR